MDFLCDIMSVDNLISSAIFRPSKEKEARTVKRVIDGRSYNTDTATVLGQVKGGKKNSGLEIETIETLYQTPSGAFFEVVHHEFYILNPLSDIWETSERTTLTPQGSEQAKVWLSGLDPTAIRHNPFQTPEETTGTATVIVRMPLSLKKQIEAAAAEGNMSVNALALRAFERYCENWNRPMAIQDYSDIDEEPASEEEPVAKERRAK
jgi:hypothetical protein